MTAYYNEFDRDKAAWLRVLIKFGLIAPGDVDERSIEDVTAADLVGYTQHHFFAGIGVWSYALRCARWPDSRPVWTASCPCPPFSVAGKKKPCPKCGSAKPLPHAFRTGFFRCTACGNDWHADGRHLWPELYRLTKEFRPVTVFGEQVGSSNGLAWSDIVQATLELEGYAVGRTPFAACGVGAPNIRQRLYWMAHTDSTRHQGNRLQSLQSEWNSYRQESGTSGLCATSGLGDAFCTGLEGLSGDGNNSNEPGRNRTHKTRPASPASVSCRLDNAISNGWGEGRDYNREHDGKQPSTAFHAVRLADTLCNKEHQEQQRPEENERKRMPNESGRCGMADSSRAPGPTNGFWGDVDWLFCRDEHWRPVEPGTFPLAHGAAARVVRLRGYGDAINAKAATEFIAAAMEVLHA